AAIYRELAERLRTRTTADWMELFIKADVPAMPMHSLDSLAADDHLQATGFFRVVEHPSEGRLRDMAYPSTWSTTQPGPTRHAPRLGEHSLEVLREIGYTEERIAALLAAGVTATGATASPSPAP
ncbi:MAG TPA: CoA transferase, partial [Burkholderiales bacterium]